MAPALRTEALSRRLERTERELPAAARTVSLVAPAGKQQSTAVRLRGDAALAGASYEKLAAEEKSTALWKAASAQPYEKLPELNSAGLLGGGLIGAVRSIGELFRFKRLKQTFDQGSDVRDPRSKLFHPFGAAAMVDIEPVAGNTVYRGFTTAGPVPSGLLAQATSGMVRLSLATPEKIGFTPGMALKLLQDGQPSRNLVAIHSLAGEPTHNFFSPTLSTTIAPPTSIPARAIAWLTSFVANPFVRKVAPEVMTLSGTAPARLDFVPTSAVAHLATGKIDFRSELSAVPVGTPLYDVYSVDAAGTKVLVAHVKTTTPFVASQFADQTLNFQHNR